jgi:multisubunit Na+/H+ antiporter MnhB subunit
MGGKSDNVLATPSGDWKERFMRCRLLRFLAIVLLVILIIVSGTLTGGIGVAVIAAVSALLLGTGYYWIRNCKPSICRVLLSILVGLGIGSLALAILWLLGVSTPQIEGVLVTSVVITGIVAIVSKVRGCI